MLDLVRNPEDRFSHNETYLKSEKRILEVDALSYGVRLNTLLARKHELNLNDVQIYNA